jgi:flagellar biosynthesis component FlhA
VVNHVPTTPRLALTPTQRLVNDTAERVTALAPGRLGSPIPTLNPATGAPAAIAELPDGDAGFLDGLVTWNTWGHVVLCLAAELRQHAWRLISRRTLTDRLDLLRPAWPAQTEAALETVGLDRLTGLLRGLLREQVSVHNLPWILDVVLDVADERGSGSDPLDDPELLRWVRVGLGLAVTSGVSRGTETLIAYLLDPVMEEEVRRSANDALAAAEERLVVALAQEQSALPPGVQTPHVLTQGDVRCAVRAALWTEFPRVNVLSHEEVPANWNVQPVARLIAPTAG